MSDYELKQAKKELALLLAEKERRFKYDKFHHFYFQDHMIDPATGLDVSRNLYTPHLEFMKATKDFRELAFIAPNRVGKTETGNFIITAITTGDYPEWWEGKKFPLDRPLRDPCLR
jgi:hypothetical protein